MHIGREAFLQVGNCIFQFLCQFYSSCIRLFCHSQQYGRPAFFRCDSQFRTFSPNFYFSYICQGYRTTAYNLHHRFGYTSDSIRRNHATQYIFIAIFVNHASTGAAVHAARHGRHLSQTHTVMLHFVRT